MKNSCAAAREIDCLYQPTWESAKTRTSRIVAILARHYGEEQALREACQAVLIFHSGGMRDEAKRTRWKEITGHDEATTKVLCDTVRAALSPQPQEAE